MGGSDRLQSVQLAQLCLQETRNPKRYRCNSFIVEIRHEFTVRNINE